MAELNIQMKKREGSKWDNLYPITLDSNVLDAKGEPLSQKLANTVNSLNTKIDNTANSLNAKIDEKHQNVVTQLEKVENKIERIKFSDLQEPIYIAHRGGANIFPENTLEAYEGCLSMGVNVIELDVQQLADGALAVMHDTTMDRTTNRSGYVRDFSTAGFKRAKVDILPGWNDVYPPLLEEVLSRFGNNAIYIIESKDQKSAKKIADTLKRYRLEEYACIQSFGLSDLQAVANEGIPLMYLSNSANPQQVKSNNIDYIGVSTSASESYIQSCISAGLKVFVYTVNRRYERDYFLNLGVSGFFTDEPLYLPGKSPVLTKDPFAEQVFTHGLIPLEADGTNVYFNRDKIAFVEPNFFGWPEVNIPRGTNHYCLQGWAGELPTAFTLTAKMKLHKSDNANFWGSIAFCTSKDFWSDNNYKNLSEGYHLLLRENGMLQLYKKPADQMAEVLEEVQTPQLVEGQTAELKIEVNSTNITITRVDTGHSFNVADKTYRRGYLHLGRRISGILFSDIHLTRIS